MSKAKGPHSSGIVSFLLFSFFQTLRLSWLTELLKNFLPLGRLELGKSVDDPGTESTQGSINALKDVSHIKLRFSGDLCYCSKDLSLSELRELVIDREAWRDVIHGVAKSWTRMSD